MTDSGQNNHEQVTSNSKQTIASDTNQRSIAPQLENLSTGLQWVNQLEQQQHWQALETGCRQAIPFHPNVARFHHLLGDALLALQRWQEAVEAYQNAIALEPNFSWSHNNLADAFLQLQRWEEAVEAYQNAIALEPNFFWSHNNLADALFQLQRWQEAAEAYQHAIALKDDFPWSHYNLGEVLSQLEQWEPASQAYQTALEIDPNLPNGWEKLADAIQEYDPLSERALQAYQQAIQENPNDIELIQKTINLFPNQVEFYLALAEAFVRNNDPDQALVVCRMALNIQPHYEKTLRLENQLLANS